MLFLKEWNLTDEFRRKERQWTRSWLLYIALPNIVCMVPFRTKWGQDVVGLKDVKLSERLQTDPDLTLQKAVQQARQSEAVKKQQTLIQTGKRGQEFNANVDAAYAGERNRSIKSYKGPTKHRWQASGKNPWQTKTADTSKQGTCQRCGKSPNHSKERCPAREAVCHKCKKPGHYEAVCRSD